MAATRLIALHINKGKTVAQCLADQTDYAMNAEKTKDGKYISTYECDPRTVDEEFLLSKREYEHITGRHQKHDVIAYQIRQSFKPGEISPEEANQIGYELAMRWTKGKHAFIVATHTDRAHIHNHITYNSTSLDCTRKFKDFHLSGLTLARLSDILCLEHRLSVITRKPYRERRKRTEYPHKPTCRDTICEAVDKALLQKPKNFDALVGLLAQVATWGDIKQILDDAMKYEVASACIPAAYVKQAAEYVQGKLAICTVIGFPNGYSTMATKVFEAGDAVDNGADEVDMVINIGFLKDGRYDEVEEEIRQIHQACKGKLLKVIIETCLLTEEEKIKACELVTKAGAEYIKTSTGFSTAGATFEDVKLMREHVGKDVKVKAAGGISSFADAEKFIELGADRLGTSRLVKIMKREG